MKKGLYGNLKIAFVQEDEVAQHGIMSLSAVLKENGFITDVFIIQVDKDIVHNILNFDPDIVACSVMTPQFKCIIKICKDIKRMKSDIFIIMGGPHPTFYKECICEQKVIDAICIGEGEFPLLELACSIRSGEQSTKVNNMWFRQNGRIIKNEIRDSISDLDALPFPDRDLYVKKYPDALHMLTFMCGRGCSFNCSYCFNKGMKELYKGKGSWVRFKSNERIIEEIQEAIIKYPAKYVFFSDDTFNLNAAKLKEFLRIYKEKINIPFLTSMRIDLASEEQIEWLKQSGVERIYVGVEHGDEEFRKKVLKRNMSNEQIIDFAKWVHKRKIRLITANIMGVPGETLNMAFSTIELNVRIKPEHAYAYVLNPYPGTDIHRYAMNKGEIRNNFSSDDLSGHGTLSFDKLFNCSSTGIVNKDISQIHNLRYFFSFLVLHPRFKPVVRILIKFPNNRFFILFWQIYEKKLLWRYADWSKRRKILVMFFKMVFH